MAKDKRSAPRKAPRPGHKGGDAESTPRKAAGENAAALDDKDEANGPDGEPGVEVMDNRSALAPDPERGGEPPMSPTREPETSQALAKMDDALPGVLFVLPIADHVLFPQMMLPLAITGRRALATLDQVRGQGELVGVVTRRPGQGSASERGGEKRGQGEHGSTAKLERAEDDPGTGGGITELYTMGTVARILQHVDFPDGTRGVMVAGLARMRIRRFIKTDPVYIVEAEYPQEIVTSERAVHALVPHLRQAFVELVKLRPDVPGEMAALVNRVEEVGRLADFVSTNIDLGISERQGLLATLEVDSRMEQVFGLLDRQLDLARLGEKTRSEFRERMERVQREHYLREQLKLIKSELGEEVDEKSMEAESYEARITEAGMPPVAEDRARYELKRLKVLPQEAAEYHVIRTYLDWLCDLPWSKRSEDNEDVIRAEHILNEDHYGLEEVKARIVEFLAVRKLRPERAGAILCLVGPPGVGKTSLGRSVARAMNREFHRVALGGMRDEAEIKGHRRTYVGAMPGRVLQGLRRVGTRNPVYMLDEIDKLASDWRGDPSSALLEVLDPAQNSGFEDHYLDLPFDLSDVMFIATANYAGQIPGPLMDRMETIEISGYIPDEKRAIARRFLFKRQLTENGLTPGQLSLGDRSTSAIIKGWTREAGVRELERRIGQVCRKVAAGIATGRLDGARKVTVRPEDLPRYLGPVRFGRITEARVSQPGIAIGLAWTPVGGEVLFIEVLATPGKGQVKVTGKLGQVMSESAQIAHSVARANAKRYGIDEAFFSDHDLHIHVPEGAVPKDGPSAGITLATAIVSAATRKGAGVAMKAHVAMTGELTLRGQVLPVGGIREKTVAAKAAGIRTLILSIENQPDVQELPDRVRRGLTFHLVETFEEVLAHALPAPWVKGHLK